MKERVAVLEVDRGKGRGEDMEMFRASKGLLVEPMVRELTSPISPMALKRRVQQKKA